MNENERHICSLRERIARLERLCAKDTRTSARLMPRKLELEAKLGELLAEHSDVVDDVVNDVGLEAELAQRLLTAHLERD